MLATARADVTAAIIQAITPELRRLVENAPPFGSISLVAFLHDSEVVRLELGATVNRQARPRADRGRA
jgi:hypothetical protein